jgi:hypothetical protein
MVERKNDLETVKKFTGSNLKIDNFALNKSQYIRYDIK